MDMTEGYEIYRTVLFETGYGFALGRMQGPPESFAVWSFTETAYGRDYYQKSSYWDRSVVEEIFRKRAKYYHIRYEMQEKTEHSTKVFYRYYSTQRPVDIGTYPRPEGNIPVIIINYDVDRRRPVAGGRLNAWGEILYDYPLAQEDIDAYELTPEPQPPEES